MVPSNVAKRRWAIRLILVAALVGVAFLMYDIGKEYSVLIDNDTVTIDGRKYPAIEYADLVIDGEKKALFFQEEDRLIRKLVGKEHTLLVKVLDDDEETVVETVERRVKLDVNTKAWMISLPAIVGGAPDIFIPNPLYSEEDERPAPSPEPDEDETGDPNDPNELPTM